MRVEIFSCGFAAAHEEEMVYHECRRVRSAKNAIDHHGERSAKMRNGLAERDVLTMHVHENLRQTGAEQEEGE